MSRPVQDKVRESSWWVVVMVVGEWGWWLMSNLVFTFGLYKDRLKINCHGGREGQGSP